MPDPIPAEAVQAAAEVLYRSYDSEYGADHLSWRDFQEQARALLEAAEPFRTQQEEEIRANERRKVIAELRALARWEMQGGYVDLFPFKERHDRLSHLSVTDLSMAYMALADEMESAVRDNS